MNSDQLAMEPRDSHVSCAKDMEYVGGAILRVQLRQERAPVAAYIAIMIQIPRYRLWKEKTEKESSFRDTFSMTRNRI